MKARKNAAELAGARAAHLRDGVAMARFLCWFDKTAPRGRLTEIAAAQALETFRRETGELQRHFLPDHFRRGAHAALPHYRVTEKSDARIGKGVYLVDSGAQYLDGTTDVTRTLAVGSAEQGFAARQHARAQGPYRHRARGFPKGTSGAQLDALRAAAALGGRARFRPRHRPWRRLLSLGARGAAAHFQARRRGAGAGHDPVQRAGLLPRRRLRHPHRKSGGGGDRATSRAPSARCSASRP